MKAAAFFLLMVGILWFLLVVGMFVTIAGIAGPPVSLAMAALYWGRMLFGPITLIAGSIWSTGRIPARKGLALTVVGCSILTGWVLYDGVALLHRQPLEAPPPYFLCSILLLLTLLSDVVVCRMCRTALRKTK